MQLIPVIGSILYPCVQKKMQHLQLKLRIILDLFTIIWKDIIVPDPKAGGIKIKLRFFFRCDPDPDLHLIISDLVLIFIEFKKVVQDRDRIRELLADQVQYVFNIHRALKSIADDVLFLLE